MSSKRQKILPQVKYVKVRGAAEHNLRSIDVDFERGSINVVTGVSGSGKSSLVFDTILAEAQRRFFYTLSHYSRQFLDVTARPMVRKLEGLSPAIALAQNETQPSRRATVGSLTDATELIGVLFARFATRHCPVHMLPTTKLTNEQVVTHVTEKFLGQNIGVFAPIVREKKGQFKNKLVELQKRGFLRIRLDGELVELSPLPQPDRDKKHTLQLLVDQIKVKDTNQERLRRSIATALEEGQGIVETIVFDQDGYHSESSCHYSTLGGCPECGYSWPKLDPRYFSPNSLGRCQACDGLGTITPLQDSATLDQNLLESFGFYPACGQCQGTGIETQKKAVTINGYSAIELHSLPLTKLKSILTEVKKDHGSSPAFLRVLEQLTANLNSIIDVGLGYLQLSRRIRSLSAGETQRLKLSGLLQTNLKGILYVFDEPSQGLHPSELDKFWQNLQAIKQNGSTILIVDHDEHMMERADWIVDLGPGGGRDGGSILAKFQPKNAKQFAKSSLTASFLADKKTLDQVACAGLGEKDAFITLSDCSLNNLKINKVRFLRRGLNVVTGVSGAGKSSLALGTFFINLSRHLAEKDFHWEYCRQISGIENIEIVQLVDRKPIAKSSVSIPASYIGVFSDIRNLYGKLPMAQIAGLSARDFSLSVEGGRCPECKGRGHITLSMRFLADARVPCSVCDGQRFRPHVLEIRYLNKSISDVLRMTLDETSDHFKNHRRIINRLRPALDLGLGYVTLGQPNATLSGGEAQRLKLAPIMSRSKVEDVVLVLDEPTTGLHFQDTDHLIKVLRGMVDRGCTIVISEHSTAMIRAADWLIDLGPGPAAEGGKLVYEGQLPGLINHQYSNTGRYLQRNLALEQKNR